MTAQPGPRRILLVEDETDLRETTAELLELLGHTVVACSGATDALAALAQGSFDVLLTDISLPDGSGEALAAQARALYPDLQLVFASGQTPQLALAGARLLLKPYSLEQLTAMLAPHAPNDAV